MANTVHRKPKTDQERMLQASKYLWLASATMTILFLNSVIALNLTDKWFYSWPIAIISGIGLQHIFTMVEKTLFNGSLPSPFDLDWRSMGPEVWMTCGAWTVLLIDVLLNFGGVQLVFGNLHTTAGAKQLPAEVVLVLQTVILFIISVFMAVGPELLREIALVGNLRRAATGIGFNTQSSEVKMQHSYQEPVANPRDPHAPTPTPLPVAATGRSESDLAKLIAQNQNIRNNRRNITKIKSGNQ